MLGEVLVVISKRKSDSKEKALSYELFLSENLDVQQHEDIPYQFMKRGVRSRGLVITNQT